jgi:hypothetical protein
VVAGFAVNFAVKAKLINDVNKRLGPDEKWEYLQYMTYFHEKRLDEQHKRFYPKSSFRVLPWITGLPMLPILVEVIRRWVYR